MTKAYQVVVVGGGVIGLTIARALAITMRGVRDLCLIERATPGTEASFAAGGMLAPQAEADSRDEFFNLCSQSRDLYPNFSAALLEETGIDIQLDTTGTLYVALNDHDQLEIEKRYQWQPDRPVDVAWRVHRGRNVRRQSERQRSCRETGRDRSQAGSLSTSERARPDR